MFIQTNVFGIIGIWKYALNILNTFFCVKLLDLTVFWYIGTSFKLCLFIEKISPRWGEYYENKNENAIQLGLEAP